MQVELTAVTKTDAPKAYNVFWKEWVTEGTQPAVEQRWAGTFTVGRIALTHQEMVLQNRLGLCVTGSYLGTATVNLTHKGRPMNRTLVLCLLLAGCAQTEGPLVEVPPMPEDLSTWTAPEVGTRANTAASHRAPRAAAKGCQCHRLSLRTWQGLSRTRGLRHGRPISS